MKQYLDVLEDILTAGDYKAPARAGMPATKEVFYRALAFNLQLGLPVLTTKKVFIKGAIAEMLWLLSGNTNIKALVDQNVKNWNDDAYKFYVRKYNAIHASVEPDLFSSPLSKDEWLENVKKYGANSQNAVWGATGNIYGHQWRNWNGSFDQLNWVLNNLKTNPNSRYHVVSSWNPTDYLEHPENVALPACYLLFQFSVREGKYLDLMMLQRSCDMFLGVPFDLIMYALLCHIFANILDLEVGEFIWTGNSCHIYENHVDQVKLQLTREPFELPILKINRKLTSLDDLTIDDFTVIGYESHDTIAAPLSVGV